MPEVIVVYSETGGATNTTTSVSLAACSAEPPSWSSWTRRAATKWIGAKPKEDWRPFPADRQCSSRYLGPSVSVDMLPTL